MASAEHIVARFRSPRVLRVSPPITLEVARTPEQLAEGLKHRTVLPYDHGMFFVFPKLGRHSFWMQDTPLPLDLAWLSPAGVVQEMRELQPFDLHQYQPQQPAAFAIELNAGSFRRFEVHVGDALALQRMTR